MGLSLTTQAQRLDNKVIPNEVYKPVVKALSYFPALDDYTIEFKFKKTLKNRVMQAQPQIKTLLKGKKNRAYKIVMSRNLFMSDSSATLDQLPHDVLVGWFVHELGHIMDYKDRSSANMFGFAINYITSKPFLKRSEKRADTYATENGGGKELLKTKKFILFKSKFPKEYKAKIKDLYPSPEEITALLSEDGEVELEIED